MVRIGLMEYEKDEEAILTRAFLLGTLFGLPLGLLLSYWLGFLANPSLALNDSIGWTFFYLKTGSVVMVTCFLITMLIALPLYKRTRKLGTGRDVGRIIFASLLVPLIIAYSLLIAGLVFTPITTLLLQFLSPVSTFAISALIFFPFVILLIAIIGPDSKPGKTLRHPLSRSKKRHE